jgi:hypothetical protein
MALHKSKLQSPVKKGLANENSFPVVKLKIEKRKYIPVNHFITQPKLNGNYNFLDLNKNDDNPQNSFIDIIENS